MEDVLRQIEALKDTGTTVLIQGESGTGKELVARALHVDGRRAAAPFVAVNCGAFTETLLESQLFGHEKGAFTGATSRHRGAFERADGGTLFLDEVGNAPPPVQIKLLRVLEERELVRVGGQEPVAVDVRLVSASNRDLKAMVEAGEFREDLYYRLNVVTIDIPPLRKRREDIRKLAESFRLAACTEHGRAVTSIDPACMALLEKYDWPGNVRQLRNAIEAGVVMARGSVLTAADIRLEAIEGSTVRGEGFVVPEGMNYAQLEKEILQQLLQRHHGNRTLVADQLQVSRRTIQRKIKEYQLPF
jgi:DNA-binding NtrC family response regulator